MSALGTVRRRLFGIPSERAVFSQPGFVEEAWLRFQPVAHSLVEGYHATLEDSRFEVLIPRLNAIDPELQGFAYEGAGMGLAALDIMAPWKNRVQDFVTGPAAPHIYPIYVGVGLALARLHRQPEHFLKRLDPLIGWVIIDGYGFHEGFFAWNRTVGKQVVPASFSSYARRLFDQGLGRCIWFASGALVDRVAGIIANFPSKRQVDLWSGVGLASAYAGGATQQEIEHLRETTSSFLPQMALGAAVAAKGREDASIQAPHTELSCQTFCGLSSAQAAHVLAVASEGLPMDGKEPAYEIWRQRTQAQFALQGERKR